VIIAILFFLSTNFKNLVALCNLSINYMILQSAECHLKQKKEKKEKKDFSYTRTDPLKIHLKNAKLS